MPTYDYLCDACGHKFEEFQNITAPVLTKCPACKKKKLRRLFGTGAAVVFKGSGFYQTDYRSDGYKKAAAKDTAGGPSKSESSESSGAKDSSAASSPSENTASSKSSETKAAPSESSTKSNSRKKKD